jgi:hypothetical protein
VRAAPDRFVGFHDDLGKEFLELKAWLREALYYHPHVLAKNAQAEPVIGDLFTAYANGKRAPAGSVRERAAVGRRGARDRRLRRRHDRSLRARRVRRSEGQGVTEVVRVVLVTAPDAETAARIARRSVEERLIACANLVPGIRLDLPLGGAGSRTRRGAARAQDPREPLCRGGGTRQGPPSLRASRGGRPPGRGWQRGLSRLGSGGELER